jgi:hypothetical protein
VSTEVQRVSLDADIQQEKNQARGEIPLYVVSDCALACVDDFDVRVAALVPPIVLAGLWEHTHMHIGRRMWRDASIHTTHFTQRTTLYALHTTHLRALAVFARLQHLRGAPGPVCGEGLGVDCLIHFLILSDALSEVVQGLKVCVCVCGMVWRVVCGEL